MTPDSLRPVGVSAAKPVRPGAARESASTSARPTVLITGASTGLGLAVAQRLLAASDYGLILTARRGSMQRFDESGIEESDRVWLRILDVTNGEQRKRVISEADDRLGGVDILINNAGVAYRSVIEHVKESERNAQMAVNFSSPMALVRLVLPSMRRKGRGHIVNISSVGGMMAMPTMAIYSASKFALEGASEALWYEVRPWGIHVTLIEPGFINSPSAWNTRFTVLSQQSTLDGEDPYHHHYEHMGRFIERSMLRSLDTPERVARRIHRLLRRKQPPLRVQVTLDAHVFSLLRRLLPRPLYHAVLYRALPGIRHWGEVPASARRPLGE